MRSRCSLCLSCLARPRSARVFALCSAARLVAEQALDALESLADVDTSTDDELESEIFAQVDTRLEHEEPTDLEETSVESGAADQETTPQNHSLLLNNDIPKEVATITPRPRRMRFDEPSNRDS